MENLNKTNSLLYEEFQHPGNFVIARTRNLFSSIGIDQRHEQLNKDAKGKGGMIGLTEDEEIFRRWGVCSPEIGRAM